MTEIKQETLFFFYFVKNLVQNPSVSRERLAVERFHVLSEFSLIFALVYVVQQCVLIETSGIGSVFA